MATNKKISELQENTAISLSDFLPIVSPGSTLTQKVNVARILALGGGGAGSSGGSGAMLDAFTINLPGNPLRANGHIVNIGDSVSSLLKLILSPAIAAVISAGSNQTVALSSSLTIALTATETSGSNLIVTRLWSIISGPAGLTINNPGQQNTTLTGFNSGSAGTYQLKYHTVDSEGTVVDSLVTELVIYNAPGISVSAANIQLPTASGNLAASINITPGSYAIQSTVYSLIQGQLATSGVSANGLFSGFLASGAYVCNVLVTDVNGHTASANIPVNVAAPAFSAVVDYVFLNYNAHDDLQAADNLNYAGHYTIPSANADWLMPWANAPANCFPVMRVLSSANQTLKNKWTDAANPTFGTDSFDDNSSSASHFTLRGYDYYTWYAPANFLNNAGNTVNITIN